MENIYTQEEIIQLFKNSIDNAQITFYPETPNTYPAYEIKIEYFSIWFNAKTGKLL